MNSYRLEGKPKLRQDPAGIVVRLLHLQGLRPNLIVPLHAWVLPEPVEHRLQSRGQIVRPALLDHLLENLRGLRPLRGQSCVEAVNRVLLLVRL